MPQRNTVQSLVDQCVKSVASKMDYWIQQVDQQGASWSSLLRKSWFKHWIEIHSLPSSLNCSFFLIDSLNTIRRNYEHPCRKQMFYKAGLQTAGNITDSLP